MVGAGFEGLPPVAIGATPMALPSEAFSAEYLALSTLAMENSTTNTTNIRVVKSA
jgi:hypothetical protein